MLLGEASHGTSEFYRARAAITRRLIERHGFTIVAVEADWPDAAAVDRYVRHRPRPAGAEPPFQRFPTWMWRNTEVDGLRRLAARATTRRGRSRSAGPASTASTSTACAARSPPCSTISTRSTREAARGRARALRLPDAVAEGARDLRPRRAHRRLSQMRAGGRSSSAASCCEQRLEYAGAGRRAASSTPRRTPA